MDRTAQAFPPIPMLIRMQACQLSFLLALNAKVDRVCIRMSGYFFEKDKLTRSRSVMFINLKSLQLLRKCRSLLGKRRLFLLERYILLNERRILRNQSVVARMKFPNPAQRPAQPAPERLDILASKRSAEACNHPEQASPNCHEDSSVEEFSGVVAMNSKAGGNPHLTCTEKSQMLIPFDNQAMWVCDFCLNAESDGAMRSRHTHAVICASCIKHLAGFTNTKVDPAASASGATQGVESE